MQLPAFVHSLFSRKMPRCGAFRQMEEKWVRKYFENQGFHVGDGLKYGVDLLLYTEHPNKVHSKYALLLDRKHTFLQIMAIQRVCNSARKTLVVVYGEEEAPVRLVHIERFLERKVDGQTRSSDTSVDVSCLESQTLF